MSAGLEGAVVLVTGASSGIGAAVADACAAAGATVVTASRRPAGHEWHELDVRDAAAVDALIADVVGRHGRLDGVVNNAGVQVEKSIADSTDADYDVVMDVNVRGVFNVARAAVRAMRDGDGGMIVNVGSIAATHADHGMALYNASKGAVQALTRAIATDHGRDGVRCVAVAPGWIMTEMADAAFDLADDPAAARAEAVAKHPVGRMGTPEDIAGLCVWLLSDAAAFASGSVFTLDGGLTAQSPIGD